MKFIRSIKQNYLSILFVGFILVCAFLYFIVYRTPSRVAWYENMYVQFENMIALLRKLTRV